MDLFTSTDGRRSFYQWDTGRQLIVHDKTCTEVHFCNGSSDCSLVCKVFTDDTQRLVNVPNVLLQDTRSITVFAFVRDDKGGYTRRAVVYSILPRTKPEDYVYTETEVLNYQTLAKRMDEWEKHGIPPEVVAGAIKEYFTENPVEAGATAEEAAQIAQNKEDIGNLKKDKLDASKLPEAVNEALAQAKQSGLFDGAPGAPGEPGQPGQPGQPGAPGDDYVLTPADKAEIAEMAAKLVEVPEQDSGGNVNQETSIFTGKTASFYGDSLTEANYHYTKGYHSWMQDLLGFTAYNNYGVSGYKVSDVYNKVNSVTDTADFVFVMCGVNDQNLSVPLGAMGDTTTDTIYGALNLLCALLKEKYPTKLVVFITPHYQTKYSNNSGVTSYEVSKAIREVCEKYAIPVYDNFVLSGIYSTNLSTFTTDNCHWNDTAHEMVGKNLARFMVTTFQYIYGNTASGGDGGDGGDGDGDDTHIHSYTGTVTTAATCTTAGVKTFTCACGESYTESIPAVGHTYVNGVCSACGAERSVRANVNATIKATEMSNMTHIGFLIEGPVGAQATVRLECDVDDISRVTPANLNAPFEYASVENFNTGKYAKIGNVAAVTKSEGHVSISNNHTSSNAYLAVFVPFYAPASNVPFSVQLSNVTVYINDVAKPILAVGTFKDNSTGTYADITVSESTF